MDAILKSFFDFLISALWIIIPTFFILIFLDIWLIYRRAKFINSFVWKTLEIKIPKTVIKSPKSMEYVFSSMHATYSGGFSLWEKWWEGKVEHWHSFEIIGQARSVNFYVRIQENYRNLIESGIYSQYPDAEINEVQDYISHFPPNLPNQVYDVWGTEYILGKDDGYPILTYTSFEESGVDEERRIDPISTIAEVMSNLKESEGIWFQILIRPTGDGWKKKAEALRDELLGKKKPPKKSFLDSFISGFGEFITNLISAPTEYPVWSEGDGAKDAPKSSDLGPGNRKIVEALENKISKLGFESVLRFVYIDKRESFSRSNIVAFWGAFKQFSTQNLNAFRPNMQTMTIARGRLKWFLKKSKVNAKKKLLFSNYKIRHLPSKFSILNTEELATIFHFPITEVKASRINRIESKRSGPPINLPIEF